MPVRSAENHRLESRVREIRTHGLEGGETGQPVFPTPIETEGANDVPHYSAIKLPQGNECFPTIFKHHSFLAWSVLHPPF